MRTTLLMIGMLLSSVAHAADVPCAPAERGTITLDGMNEDWRDVAAVTAGEADAELSVRCNTEGKTLYLEIEATDTRVVRTKQARAGEDQVALRLGNTHFSVFPTSGAVKAKLVGKAKMASTTSDRGFIIELAVPLASFGKNRERVPFALRFDDCDSAVALKTERSVSIDGDLAFTAGPSTLDSFLEDRNLPRSTIRWQKTVRGGRPVQLVLAGKYIAMISDGFSFIELPVTDGKDVRDPELVELAGDGRTALLLRYTERGGDGSRDVLAAFRPDGSSLRRVFAAEIGKQTRAGRLTTKVTLKKHGRGTDVVLEAQPAQGLDANNYSESPAADIVPILLPWSADKRATYGFSGNEYRLR